jgi:hypothetical protein
MDSSPPGVFLGSMQVWKDSFDFKQNKLGNDTENLDLRCPMHSLQKSLEKAQTRSKIASERTETRVNISNQLPSSYRRK